MKEHTPGREKHMRRCIALAVTAFVAAEIASTAQAQPFSSQSYQPAQTTFQSDRKKQKSGWQTPLVVTISNGQPDLQWGYNCPTKFPVAVSGSFAFNSVGQTDTVYLSFNGPRDDESPPSYTAWGWHFLWPNGAKSGETMIVNVYCVAAP